MPKIGELLERTDWNNDRYFPAFDASDPANPDIKISMGTIRTASVSLTNKRLGTGTVIDDGAEHTTAQNLGTPGTGVTAVERGDGTRHKSILTLEDFAVGNSADGASLALGAVFYTLPAGALIIRAAYMAVGLTLADAVQTDTPEIGIGTVVGSGANATLGAVGATSENVFEGTAVADVAGTVFTGFKGPTAGVPLLLAAGDPHTLFLNVADGWANLSGPSAITADGTIVLLWDFVF